MRNKHILGSIIACIMFNIVSLIAAERIRVENISPESIRQRLKSLSLNIHDKYALERILNMDINYEFRQIRSNKADNGYSHYRYGMEYRKLPIWGRQLIVHENKYGELYELTGTIIKGLEKDFPDSNSIKPKKDITNVITTLKEYTTKKMAGDKGSMKFNNESIDTVIYYDDKANKPYLAYYIYYYAANTVTYRVSMPNYIIDAETGVILKEWEGFVNNLANGSGPGGNIKIGQYEYGVDRSYFPVDQNGQTCSMNTSTVQTFNLNHDPNMLEPPFTGLMPYEYPCYRNTFGIFNYGYAPLNDAHYYAGYVNSIYNQLFGIDAYTLPIKIYAHHINDTNAGIYSQINVIVFGDGGDDYYPYSTSIDPVAHEIGHGFTFKSILVADAADLGAIHESYADMTAVEAKYHYSGNQNSVFTIGEQITKNKLAERYMYNPPLDGSSIDNIAQFLPPMDPHFSAGIYNKAFYNLATTNNWNIEKAFRTFTYANYNYWNEDSILTTAANDVVKAAYMLNYNTTDVINAFNGVGISCIEPLPTPNLFADSHPGNGVEVRWCVDRSVPAFEVEKLGQSTTTISGGNGCMSWWDYSVSNGTTYAYRIRSKDNQGNLGEWSNRDIATMISYSDDPIISGQTNIKAQHIYELRNAISSIRSCAGISQPTWTDSNVTGISAKAIHLYELRSNINEALNALNIQLPTYSDPNISGQTPNGTITIKANHIQEIRNISK